MDIYKKEKAKESFVQNCAFQFFKFLSDNYILSVITLEKSKGKHLLIFYTVAPYGPKIMANMLMFAKMYNMEFMGSTKVGSYSFKYIFKPKSQT